MLFPQRTLKLNFTITWKIHMVCCHLEPLRTSMGTGLAIVTEQAGEAVHCKYKPTKSLYQVNSYHQNHGKAQKAAVVNWSSWNVHALSKASIQRYREKFRRRRKVGKL